MARHTIPLRPASDAVTSAPSLRTVESQTSTTHNTDIPVTTHAIRRTHDKHDDDTTSMSIIHADVLIPGRGKPKSHGSVILKSSKIHWVGPTSSLPTKYHHLPSTHVPYLLPGLWDVHLHLIGTKTLKFQEIFLNPPILSGARLVQSVHDILMAGFTSVRDLGSWACELIPAIEEGSIVGPNIYPAGAFLSQTAGHGDVDLPMGFVNSRFGIRDPYANNNELGRNPGIIADGVDEVRRAVRLNVRRGAKVIKVFASGGVLSIVDDPMRQQYSDEELRTIVEEAERHGRVVAAHVHGKPGIMAALKAGVRTIEHGTYMDDECVELMKKNDVVYVPTRTVVRVIVDHPELLDEESYKKALVVSKHHIDAYKLAVKHGVRIALGTDLGVSFPTSSPAAHGRNGTEIAYAVEDGGMSPLQAIEAATANGPLTLGGLGMAPRSGDIKEGFDADLIAMGKDPLKDIGLFKDPGNVTHVWKGGRLFKSPGMEKRVFGLEGGKGEGKGEKLDWKMVGGCGCW